jgi:hypothetical protein
VNLDALPDRLKQAVADELQPGEAVRWAGRPDPARFARRSWAVAAFGVFWLAFGVFWMAMTAGMLNGGPGGVIGVVFPLFGLPVLLVGVGLITSPLWIYRVGLHTVYLVTDRRAVLIRTLLGHLHVNSYGPADLTSLTRVERADGSGDVLFARTAYRDADGYRRTRAVGFHAVPDVRRVEGLLRDLAATAG